MVTILSVRFKKLARNGERKMTLQKWTVLSLLVAALAVSACAPLLVGGAAAVVADEAIEQDQGGDGLF